MAADLACALGIFAERLNAAGKSMPTRCTHRKPSVMQCITMSTSGQSLLSSSKGDISFAWGSVFSSVHPSTCSPAFLSSTLPSSSACASGSLPPGPLRHRPCGKSPRPHSSTGSLPAEQEKKVDVQPDPHRGWYLRSHHPLLRTCL